VTYFRPAYPSPERTTPEKSRFLARSGLLPKDESVAEARSVPPPASPPRKRIPIGKIAVLALAAVAAGVIAAPPQKLQMHLGPHPTVTLDGKPLPLDGDEAKTLDAARAIARAYLAERVSITVLGSGSRERAREELGARVDPERLASLVRESRDPRSALRRAHAQVAFGRELRLPLPVSADVRRATMALIQVKDDLDKPPVDAKLDLEASRVAPDEPGRRMDVYATLARLDDALVKGHDKIEAVVEAIPAARRAEQLKDVRIDDVLGYFETRYAADQKHEARTYNLRLAASKLDGYVIMPGETFDFNDIVGPRTEANGYKVAPVIAQGELVDGIGGGTCQIAGTLHGAAFFAGLDILERHPHTRPSFYIKMGMDSTVAYPTITMKFRNPFPFPIVLHEKVQKGMVRAEVLGPRRSRDVTYVRHINEVIPFQEREVQDPKIPKGKRQLQQRGIPGFKITRYRIVRDGPFAVRERMQDTYPPTSQIWRVGSGDDNTKWKPADDDHPEYVADEYLVVSQGPNVQTLRPSEIPDRGGPTVESRVAGRYGTHGWTVREGFAKALHGSKGGGGTDDKPGVD
jgi:vancomycin resistance protein YoaR